MLKWLAGSRPRSPLADVVTDDPLAAIRVHRPLEIYAVSRVNPLFDDEVSALKDRPTAAGSQADGSDSPNNKSNSSGYGSPRYHSSSDYSSGTEEINGQRVYVGSSRGPAPAVLRHDALAVLEQNVAFVKSILVAARRQRRRTPQLTPIPEGRLEHAIPRPVWPRRPRREPLRAAAGATLVLCAGVSPLSGPPTTEAVLRELSDTLSRGLVPVGGSSDDSPTCEIDDLPPPPTTTATASEEVLRELSHTISRGLGPPGGSSEGSPAYENHDLPPPPSPTTTAATATEAVLRELSNTLSRGLGPPRGSTEGSPTSDTHKPPTPTSTTEAALRELSDTLSRGLVPPRGSSEGSPTPAALERGPPPKESDDDTQPRESSSSSSRASSSGFSDATPSPPAGSARGAATLYGAGRARPATYEKLAAAPTSRDGSPRGGDERDAGLWTTYVGAGVVKGDVQLKTDTKCYYPSLERPDFTLDAHSAERLMRRIKSAKRRRCWCRVATSLLGLLFFLLAVMAVSLLLTRGERVFGSL